MMPFVHAPLIPRAAQEVGVSARSIFKTEVVPKHELAGRTCKGETNMGKGGDYVGVCIS